MGGWWWWMYFTTAASCWRFGCSRVLPRGAGAGPVGCQAPRTLAAQSLWPPGTKGPVRRALQGSALPGRAAGSRLRSLKHAARGWPGASSTKALARGGNPISTPFSPFPPSRRPRGTCPTGLGVRQANSAPPLLAPSRAGCPPWQTTGHSSPPPGARRLALVRTPESASLLPFLVEGPPSLSASSPRRAPAACFPWPGDPASFFFSLRRKDSLCRVLFSPSLLGTPSHSHSPVDGPEAGEERTFPGSRFPPSRKSCVLCMSDSVALRLGDLPEFGDRQLLQGMTSKRNSKRICRGFG